MDLTRRDALAALVSAGIVGGGAAATLAREPDREGDGAELVEALVGVAGVVYPPEVSNVREFVTAYSRGRLRADEDYRRGAVAALEALDARAEIGFDADRFVALEAGAREALLSQVGADTAEPDPGGSTAERVRYYLVNEVLYALYTSPAGGRLVGIENPQGHPGGIGSYRRGPGE